MNPFPLSLSSPVSHFISGSLFVLMSIYIALYLVLFVRQGALVSVRAKLAGEVVFLRLGRYEYEVNGKTYWRFCLPGSQAFLSGPTSENNEGKSNAPLRKNVVIKYDPFFPWFSCVKCRISMPVAFMALVLWVLFLCIFFHF